MDRNDIQWSITFIICQALVFALTSWRLLYRSAHQRRFLWWDDAMSAVATMGSIVMFAHQCISVQAISNKKQGIGYWVVMDAKSITTWATRICIILSVGRLYKDLEKTFRIFRLLSFIVLTMGISLFAITNYECAAQLSWLTINGSRCPTTKITVIAIYAVESSIDVILMFLLPLYVRRILKHPVHRRVVFAAYSSTAWILVVNTAFTIAFLYEPLVSRTVIIWLANLSIIACVIQCNLSVITGIIYKKFFKETTRNDFGLSEISSC